MDAVRSVEVPADWWNLPARFESDDEAWRYIQAIDLSSVRTRLLNPRWGRPVPAPVLDHAERDYRRFLFLIRKHEDQVTFSPTVDMDLVWHEHIIHTIQYLRDTTALFGRYLHHQPFERLAGRAPADGDDPFEHTVECYAAAFGEPPMTYFGHLGNGHH